MGMAATLFMAPCFQISAIASAVIKVPSVQKGVYMKKKKSCENRRRRNVRRM